MWRQFEIDHKGRRISGSYSYDPDTQIVEVKAANGACKLAWQGGKAVELLAARMLGELADDRKV